MYLGFYNFYKHCNKNRMLTDSSSTIGDDLMYGFVFAGQKLRERGHQLATLDMDALENFNVGLFFDHPTALDLYYRKLRALPGKKLYLFLFENEANRPDQYWRANHRAFEKIFTWHTDWIDHKKYLPLCYPIKIPTNFILDPAVKKKFCVTIASQKYNSHPKELYSERTRAIRWFEREHPADFDLYGQGWDRRYISGRLSRLNLLLLKIYPRFPNSFRIHQFPSWRGAVPNKNAVMREYKFAICYENAAFPGYVTEKIFDGFFAGCVPIYLGAPNVADYIPAGAFIDRRNFNSYEELYAYLKGMPETEYAGYLAAIEDFVRGEKIKMFSPESFADLIIKQIAEPLHVA